MKETTLAFILTFLIHILLFLIPIKNIVPDKNTEVYSTKVSKTSLQFTLKKDSKKTGITHDQRGIAGSAFKKKSFPGDRKEALLFKFSEPIYPKKALNYDLEGKVTARVNINKKGFVTKVKILKSSSHYVLDKSFTKALYTTYQFKPRRVMGKNMSSKLTLSYDFKL